MALPAQGALAAGSPGGASAPTASRTAGAAPRVHRIRSSGIATWFGPGFYGQKTACGQVLTPEVIGVAHRTLPCGTLVRVSYAGRTITVPVLDRGPYSFADWDLTAGAARALGVSDTVRIRTKVVGHAANTPGLGLPPGSTSQSLAGGALAG
jgi:rare lipoprotein A (peptidoglycan hydrolase)